MQVTVRESIESLKSVNPPSLEEVSKKLSVKLLSELAETQSVKEEKGEVIYRGSTAGGPHLNWGDLRRAERLRRYARLRPHFVNDLGDGITWRGSTVLAPARSDDSESKLYNSLSEDKIDDCEDVISRSWRLSNSRDVAISEKADAWKLSAITILIASKNKIK